MLHGHGYTPNKLMVYYNVYYKLMYDVVTIHALTNSSLSWIHSHL